MNTFKRKSLYAALASVGALGVMGSAEAVNVSPEGVGQALIYPYYTTRADALGNAYASLLSVVNTSSSAKAVKVRFLEGKNSREVLDFNLFLSKFDVWTAAILPNSSGGASVGTADKSCTLPAIPATGKDFVNYAYTGSLSDKGGASLDRTKEGYVEIIEMASFPSFTTTAHWVTHVGGVPPGCGDLIADGPSFDQVHSDIFDLSKGGDLFGGMTLINVNSGTDFTEDAVALANFIRFGNLYNDPGVIKPDLRDADLVSQVLYQAAGVIVTSDWPAAGVNGNPDPVSAVLMHDQVMNEFVLDSGTASTTDWVITFPTKRYYVNTGTGNAPKLFQRNFNTTEGSCDDVSLALYDREETRIQVFDFSPPPPTQTAALCWEANVLTFNAKITTPTVLSRTLGSNNTSNITTGFQNGWLNLGFPTLITGADPFVHQLRSSSSFAVSTFGSFASATTATYFGLPVVGFAVQSFSNGTVPGAGGNVLSNYGGNFIHKTTTLITP